MTNDLHEAKQRLLDKLGPSYGIYIQLLGRWFRGLISKEEFDKNAKQLIKQNFVLEHNKFWLAFFHHCANNHKYRLTDGILLDQKTIHSDNHAGYTDHTNESSTSNFQSNLANCQGSKVRCLPSKVISHMKIFVIAWEMGLDSASDEVSTYIDLALQHFLKNIITELISTKTAYRLRENRFKYAIGVKPVNPYLSNSLKIFSSNLEYDPYQIESNKMNSSLVDTYAYNDSLFPSRLYETQALYEYACSTSTIGDLRNKQSKRLKMSPLTLTDDSDEAELTAIQNLGPNLKQNGYSHRAELDTTKDINSFGSTNKLVDLDRQECFSRKSLTNERRLNLLHLLVALLSNRTIIPSHSMYSIYLEKIFTRLYQH